MVSSLQLFITFIDINISFSTLLNSSNDSGFEFIIEDIFSNIIIINYFDVNFFICFFFRYYLLLLNNLINIVKNLLLYYNIKLNN